MGFVHHSNFLRYFEIGRTELLRASGGRYRDMEDAGMLVVVVRVDCQYKLPVRYDDVIQVHTRIANVTAAKIIHEYSITRDHTDPSRVPDTVVRANVTMAVVDRSGRLQRVPETLVQQYNDSQ
jgi:acyl-CoA thioester hydrolase